MVHRSHITWVASATLAALSFGSAVSAEPTARITSAKDLIDVPAAPPPALWSWPLEQSFVAPNGLRVNVLPKLDDALVTASLFVPAGIYAETASTRGAAELVLGWLRSGSSRRGGLPLELLVEQLGADVQAQVGSFGTTLSCKAMSPRLAGCLSLLSDLVQSPAFAKESLFPARAHLAAQSRQQLSSDEGRARLHLANLIFGDNHPGGRPVLADDVGALSEADLRQFWSRWYRPQLAHLVVVGNVAPAAVQKAALAAFRGWKSTPAAAKVAMPPLPQREGTRLLLVDQPTATQATIMFGHLAAPRNVAQAAGLEALAFLFGGAGFGSRLALDVAALGVISAGGASIEPTPEGSLFRATLQAPPSKAWDALLAAANQLKALQETPVTPAELAELKARSAALDPFQLETGDGLASAVLQSHAGKTGGLTFLKTLATSVVALDQAALSNAAKLLQPNNLAVVIVGPAKRIAPKLVAAKVRFESIAFEDPISTATRARRRQLASAAGANPTESLPARALIIKALAAAGGAPAWRALSTLTVKKKGQRRDGAKVATLLSTSHYRRPQDLRVDQEVLLQGKVVSKASFIITDRDVRGTNANGKMGPLPARNVGDLKAAAFEDVIFILLHALEKKPPLPMSLKADWVENGVAYPGLEVQVPSGSWVSLYFDPATHLLSRIRSPDVAGGESEQRLSDWRDIGGLKFPFKQVSLGVNTSEAQLVDVQINPALDAKLFE